MLYEDPSLSQCGGDLLRNWIVAQIRRMNQPSDPECFCEATGRGTAYEYSGLFVSAGSTRWPSASRTLLSHNNSSSKSASIAARAIETYHDGSRWPRISSV